jgi:hypothetical protein
MFYRIKKNRKERAEKKTSLSLLISAIHDVIKKDSQTERGKRSNSFLIKGRDNGDDNVFYDLFYSLISSR